MRLRGLRMDDPRSGLRLRVAEVDEEGGTRLTIEYSLPPGPGRPHLPPHWHRGWEERFEIVSGRARYRLGRREAALTAGESVVLPAGRAHTHPWNDGADALRVRQEITVLRPDPGLLRETLLALAMLAWHAREGRVGRGGLPPVLVAAPLLRRLQRGGIYTPGVPAAVQDGVTAVLAAWGERRGHRVFDPACLEYDEVPVGD